MGIVFSNAALLAQARESGVRFDRILTIGHLTLYLSPHQIRKLASRYGVAIDPSTYANGEYADRFLREFLDARSVMSLDCSNYEGCDIVHDMNLPVDPIHHEQFDVVIDGGSLEHVFHFPTAIANCMNMVKPGGSVFLFTMASNHSGHGFYQFSPELFFRVFQPENGFEIRDVILELHSFPGAELSCRTKCYSVVDPAELKMRVGLVSKSPVMMMIHATKIASKPPFAKFPIQSDYDARHSGRGDPPDVPQNARGFVSSLRNMARACLNAMPAACRNFINGHRQLRHYSIHNKRFYKRWYPL